jgi:hypothetical protein
VWTERTLTACLVIASLSDEMLMQKISPILVAAAQHECPWLVTFNDRHYRPGHPDVAVLSPGEFVQRVRSLLSALNR